MSNGAAVIRKSFTKLLFELLIKSIEKGRISLKSIKTLDFAVIIAVDSLSPVLSGVLLNPLTCANVSVCFSSKMKCEIEQYVTLLINNMR